MKKKDIRHYYKNRRCQLTHAQINKLDDLLLIQFQKLAIDIPCLIMTYSPIEELNEFDPQTITDYCYFKNPNQQLLYPVVVDGVEGTNEILPVMVSEETVFEKNQFGVAEPTNGMEVSPDDIDMIIVPLFGFDKKGYRVGYGRGFYDRFLSRCRKDCIKVGFSYFEPVDEIEDVCSLDVKLNYCITHEKFYIF
jgi:5-formyltetrahydrofolate cyclo-ligase